MQRVALFIGVCFLAVSSYTQTYAAEEPAYDELSIYLNVQGLGGSEIDAVIKGKNAYLSVSALFQRLQIKNKLSSTLDSLSGFYIHQKDEYMIDAAAQQITLAGKTYALDHEALIKTSTGLYLRVDYFGKVFSLNCAFDFSTLSVNLQTKLELPILLEQKRAMLRKNVNGLKKEFIADTTIKKGYRGFNLGAVDWTLSSMQSGKITSTMANLQLGAVVAGGETNLDLSYLNRSKFNTRQQYYRWRYVNNDNPLLRQVVLGKLPLQSVSTLLGGVIGVQLSNASTLLRKSQGTYTLSNSTKPDWIVELYINGVLVDYVKADASGFYSFQVPVVYGTSAIRLRFLGPYGEEESQEQQVMVPYNFLPKGELEYTLSNGMLDDGMQTRFSRTAFKYGQSDRVTLGAGLEYLSKLRLDPYIPFLNVSYRPAANLFLSAEHALNIRSKANVSYRLQNDMLVEADYTRYKQGQQAIVNNSLEDRKLMISKQFRNKGLSFYTRMAVSQLIYPLAKQTYADFLLSCVYRGLSTNLTTYALLTDGNDPLLYTNMAFSVKLPLKTTFRPQAQYAYYTRQLNSYRIEMEKQLFGAGFLNVTFDHNLRYKTKNFTIGLRFDLSMLSAAFSVSTNQYQTTSAQSFHGGMVFDQKAGYFKANNRSNAGKAGLIIYPYLDLNDNQKRDANEPKVMGLQIKVDGGRIENNLADTTIRVMELEAYRFYLMEVNPSSFDNIAWQLKNKSYKIMAEPNQLKMIEVPVQVLGEVSGKVMLQTSEAELTEGKDTKAVVKQGKVNERNIKIGISTEGKRGVPDVTVEKGMEGITLSVYQENGVLIKSITTDTEGYFDLLGLAVGTYTLRLDAAQLQKMDLESLAASSYHFTIRASLEGDVVSNVKFKLRPKLN